MADKPPPPRRAPPLPPKYDYEEHYTAPAVNSGTVSTVTNSILTAYKINPVMVSMILLLIVILGALGFYMTRNDDRIAAYIAARDQQQADLWDRLVAMAKDCQNRQLNKDAYPSLEFPKLMTSPQATPNQRDGKQ